MMQIGPNTMEQLSYSAVKANPEAYAETAEPKPVEPEPTPVVEAPVVEVPEEETEDAALAAEEGAAEVPPVTDPEASKEPKRDRSAEKRIAKLVKEREQLKGQLDLVLRQPQAPGTPQTPQPVIDPEAPNPANYTDELDYKLDVRDYQRSKAKAEAEVVSKVQAAYDKYPDLADLVGGDESRSNATMTQIIKESAVFADLWHHLMSHPDEANRIAKLGPIQTAKEMGIIEHSLKVPVVSKTPV